MYKDTGKLVFGTTTSRFSVPFVEGRSPIAAYLQRLSTRSSLILARRKAKYGRARTSSRGRKTVIKKKKEELAPKKEATKSLWTRKLESEEYSKFLGYKLNVQPIVQEKLFVKTLGGPGTYDVDCNTFKTGLMDNGKIFTTSKRWDPVQKCDAPPVGHYNTGTFRDSSTKEKMTRVPPFEWDGLRERFRPSYAQKWKVPPNTYNPRDSTGMEALLSKVVSTRGPYDCFTGPRDGSTIKNHFTVRPTEGTDTLYNTLDGLDFLLTHPRKRNYGAIYKGAYGMRERQPCWQHHKHNEYCKVQPDTPGPATYNIDSHVIKKVKRSKVPFNSSVQNSHPTVKPEISPGPGRYFSYAKKIKGKRKNSTIYASKILLNILTAPKPAAIDQKSLRSVNL